MSAPAYDAVADGGYVAWKYGTQPHFGNWERVKRSHRATLFMLDGSALFRKVLFPGYKERRARRTAEDPRRMAMRQRTRAFLSVLRSDPALHCLCVPECEADDLVAWYFLQRRAAAPTVIGEDKDYMQLPDLAQRLRPGLQWRQTRPFPAYAPHAQTGPEFLLLQGLFGDRSDSVPRLLSSRPARAAETLQRIWASDAPYFRAAELFGELLLLNLRLLVLPGEALLLENERAAFSGDRLLALLQSGTYWCSERFLGWQEVLELPGAEWGAVEALW